jgi:hypothetical protein
MSVGLSGQLEDFGIADVFQLIGQQRKTGILELKANAERAQIIFDQGLVVTAAPIASRSSDMDPVADMMMRCGLLTRERADDASSACRSSAQTVVRFAVERHWVVDGDAQRIENLLTRDTIFDVLRWKKGSFDFRAQNVDHDKDPASMLGAEQILMDGLRMVDEWASIEGLVPSDDTVFHRVGRFETYEENAGSSTPTQVGHAEQVFSLLDGRLPVRRVVDISQLGRFDAMRALADLHRAGVTRRLAPEGVRQLKRHLRSGVGLTEMLRQGLAVALPVGLLLLAVFLTYTHEAVTSATGEGLFPIKPVELASVRESYATRRVRNAVELFRLSEGRWPDRLGELEERELFESNELAAPSGRPYYSANRDDGFYVLAPDR